MPPVADGFQPGTHININVIGARCSSGYVQKNRGSFVFFLSEAAQSDGSWKVEEAISSTTKMEVAYFSLSSSQNGGTAGVYFQFLLFTAQRRTNIRKSTLL